MNQDSAILDPHPQDDPRDTAYNIMKKKGSLTNDDLISIPRIVENIAETESVLVKQLREAIVSQR